MMTAMKDFFSMIWQGLQSLVLPPFNISAASFLLGIFVVDVSIAIFGTLIHIYGGTSHAISRTGKSVSRKFKK